MLPRRTLHCPLPACDAGELLEFGRRFLQVQKEIVGEDVEVAVLADEAAIDAAVIGVADAVELFRIGDGEAAQENPLHQREDRRIGADAEGQRDDRCQR